jgi:pentapeptide MXKDX repeat protein
VAPAACIKQTMGVIMTVRRHAVPIAAALAVSSVLLLATGGSAQEKMKDGMGKGDTMMKGDMMKKDDMATEKMKKGDMDGGDMKKDDMTMKKDEMKK